VTGDPQGLAFDPVAEDYDRGRTGWPPEVADGIAGEVVVDLAAGTGKLAEALVARFSRVIAVEPGEGMRAVLARKLPSVDVRVGTAEAIPLEDGSVDAVFVGDAFHWFDPVAAGAEIRRVLRPGGEAVVCFHEARGPVQLPAEVQALLEETIRRAGPTGTPKVESGAWKEAFADPSAWSPLVESTVDHEVVVDHEQTLATFVSMSSVARLPAGEREEIRARFAAVLPHGEQSYELTARVFRAVRLDG
jgi:ubiquinone/menaquinone biosynthesis C-methylase UbiE